VRRLAIAVSTFLMMTFIGMAAHTNLTAAVEKKPAKDVVYITKTGKKFHRSNCRTLKKSKRIEISRQEAIKKGYKACKVCKP